MRQSKKCIDGKEHKWKRLGNLLLSEPIRPAPKPTPGVQQSGTLSWPVMGTSPSFWYPTIVQKVADVEVWQCSKCGEVKLTSNALSKAMENA